jgi:hypothetical protein
MPHFGAAMHTMRAWLLLFAAVRPVWTQSTGKVRYETNAVAGTRSYTLSNAWLGEPGRAMPFELDFRPGAVSTIATSNAVYSDYWSSPREGVYVDRFVVPNGKFNGTFVAAQPAAPAHIAFAQLAGARGATVCGSSMHFGVVPDECASDTFVTTFCTVSDGCRVAARLADGTLVAAIMDVHAMPACDHQLRLELTSNQSQGKLVCAGADFRFNPLSVGASLHAHDGTTMTVYFLPRGDTALEEFVLIMAILVVLLLWIQNAYSMMHRTDVSKKHLAVLMFDALLTISFTTITMLTTSGSTVVPALVTVAYGSVATHWLLVAIAVVFLVGPAIALSSAMVSWVTKLEGASAKHDVLQRMTAATARCVFEVLLIFAFYLAVPFTLGASLRHTMGVFLGITGMAVIGRDIQVARYGAVPLFAKVVEVVWAVLAVGVLGLVMVFPVMYDSAGVTNASALAVTVATCVSAVAAGAMMRATP